ncbi:MAG: ADOP family duplicated permease, partial [Bryobacteraceae bacterium]
LHDDPSHVERVMWLHVAGRLKPGVTEKRAEASVNVVFQQILRDGAGSNPSAERLRTFSQEKIQMHPGDKGASSLREHFSEPLMVLMTVVGLVLLIACANVANLLLARATARQKEIGIRLALGARKSRLIRQLLTESVILALIGGALGVVFAYWGSRLLLQVVSQGPQPIPLDVHPDARILAFTAAISILTGLLFGLAPALRATGVDVNSTLKESSRGVIGGRGRMGLGKALVISQVAISLLLLIGAGLFVRTLRNLETVDLGYPRDHLLLIGVDPTSAGYKGAQLGPVYRRILERFQTIPGVKAVTLSENGLFSGSESGDQIAVEGYKSQKEHARFDQVGPDYFSTLGIPILLGRGIEARDTENSPYVCVINETMAKFFFGRANPIGKHVTDLFPDTRTTLEIVGVSKDDRDHNLRGEIQRRFYIPFFHGLGGVPPFANFELRTLASPQSIIAAARKQVQQVDPSLPVNSVATLDENLSRNLTQERLIARLSAFFGLLALLLAAVGLYGVLSYAIARRTNEIGIRMALGASRGQVAGMILRETLTLVVIGTVIGVPVAIGASRLVTSRLYGLKGADPVTLIVAVLVLAIVAAAAAYLPARRASKVDP